MKIKKFKDFKQVNEKIDWSKKPWLWLKKIMNLEEPEIEEDDIQEDETENENV